jgi:hypothetical protein
MTREAKSLKTRTVEDNFCVVKIVRLGCARPSTHARFEARRKLSRAALHASSWTHDDFAGANGAEKLCLRSAFIAMSKVGHGQNDIGRADFAISEFRNSEVISF